MLLVPHSMLKPILFGSRVKGPFAQCWPATSCVFALATPEPRPVHLGQRLGAGNRGGDKRVEEPLGLLLGPLPHTAGGRRVHEGRDKSQP